MPNDDYIAFDNPEHKRLERLLSELLHRPPETFARTTDGCQLPNYALSIKEIATALEMGSWKSLNRMLYEQKKERNA